MIRQALNDGTSSLGREALQLLKYHGIYEQRGRDERLASKAMGVEAEPSYMIRVAVTAGVLTAEQYLGLDRFARDVSGTGALRLTTRQCVQLHGLRKGDLRPAMRRLDELGLSGRCGCGDIARNIMAPAAPLDTPDYRAARALAHELRTALCPPMPSYEQLWLDRKATAGDELERLYSRQYLPRKFKLGIALPDDNSVEVHSQDVGLVLVMDGSTFRGVNLLVGGGLGMTHGNGRTFARLASELAYVEAGHVVNAVRIILAIFRDFGDRTDRKHARLKYLVEAFGVEDFRAELARRAGFEIQPCVPLPRLKHRDWLGLHEQGNGRHFLGLDVPSGRVVDQDRVRRRSALRTIVEHLRPSVIMTPQQNLLLGDLSEASIATARGVLEAYNVPAVEALTGVRRHAMACPAWPSCGQALNEAERVMPGVIDTVEADLVRLGLADVPLTVRMTGCPNGCARPYTADIGLVGHKPGCYDLFVGGGLNGDRLGEFYAGNVPLKDIAATLRPLLAQWRDRRQPGEGLGEYCHRVHGAGGTNGRLLTGSREEPAGSRWGTLGGNGGQTP